MCRQGIWECAIWSCDSQLLFFLQVVAPVRETAAQALGAGLTGMSPGQVLQVLHLVSQPGTEGLLNNLARVVLHFVLGASRCTCCLMF